MRLRVDQAASLQPPPLAALTATHRYHEVHQYLLHAQPQPRAPLKNNTLTPQTQAYKTYIPNPNLFNFEFLSLF